MYVDGKSGKLGASDCGGHFDWEYYSFRLDRIL